MRVGRRKEGKIQGSLGALFRNMTGGVLLNWGHEKRHGGMAQVVRANSGRTRSPMGRREGQER